MLSVDASKIQTEKRVKELVGIVSGLNRQIQDAILQAVSGRLDDSRLRTELGKVQALARSTDAEIRTWLVANVPLEYVDGLNIANRKLRLSLATLERFQQNKEFILHRGAVNVLLKDSYLDFGNTMVGVVKGAERILNGALRQQIQQGMSVGEITGAGAREIARQVRDTLAENGFQVLINKAGAQWQLSDYSEMLARTHLIKSANEGVVNRLREAGSDIVEWSSSPDERECEVCASLDGKLFSLTGDSQQYDQLESQPPIHPNCRCSLVPRPDLDEQ